MGIRISQPTDQAKQNNFKIHQSTESRGSPTVLLTTKEPQRNDNATKLICLDQSAVVMADSSSSSSNSTTSSTNGPQLGMSPKSDNRGLSQSCEAIPESSTFYFEKSILSNVETVYKKPNNVRPPWKPSVVKTHYNYNSPKELFENMNHYTRPIMGKSHPSSRHLTRSRPVERRHREVSATFSSLCDVRIHTGAAHLRQCSAARKVQAHKTDLDDIKSMMDTPNYLRIPNQRRVKQQTIALRSVYCQTPFRRNRAWYSSDLRFHARRPVFRRKPSVASSEPTSPTPSCDLSSQQRWINPFSTMHDDPFPLRYVFYVEELPRSVRAFSNSGKVSSIARETHCRVYFHTRIQRPLADAAGHALFGQTNGTRRIPSFIEPALYYLGKRVRPVTVAAPNLTSLLRFVQLLDVHYPEFGASALLADQLISSGKRKKEAESGGTISL